MPPPSHRRLESDSSPYSSPSLRSHWNERRAQIGDEREGEREKSEQKRESRSRFNRMENSIRVQVRPTSLPLVVPLLLLLQATAAPSMGLSDQQAALGAGPQDRSFGGLLRSRAA